MSGLLNLVSENALFNLYSVLEPERIRPNRDTRLRASRCLEDLRPLGSFATSKGTQMIVVSEVQRFTSDVRTRRRNLWSHMGILLCWVAVKDFNSSYHNTELQ